jgi:hypothetical protein
MSKGSQWLTQFAKNVTSQCGEDGIIDKVLELMEETNFWCVEFGAWDGITLSNTYSLIRNKGYSAVLIEADRAKFRELVRNCESSGKVMPVCASVGFEPENCLDVLLRRHAPGVPVDFDVLSIDIDGADYYVWEAVRHYRPKVVVIEYNPTIPNSVEFVQARDLRVAQGSSLASIDKLAKRKGYELVAVTELSGIFVESELFRLFGIQDNSVAAMRTRQPYVTHIFSGYDGTVFLGGCRNLIWLGTPYRESKVQQIPRWLREYPGRYGAIRRVLWRLYRYLSRQNLLGR